MFHFFFFFSDRNLGFTVKSNMNLQPPHFSPIISFLTADILLCYFVWSRLDYCNSFLSGCLVYKLQQLQNFAARLILWTCTRHAQCLNIMMVLTATISVFRYTAGSITVVWPSGRVQTERRRKRESCRRNKCSKGVQFVRELCSCGAPGGAM